MLNVFQTWFPRGDSAVGLHKPLLILAALLVCLYSVAVLYATRLVPDIGLHCAFSLDVARVDNGQLRPAGDQPLPQVKDRIVKLGDQTIENWPQLLIELGKLRTRARNADSPTYGVHNGEEVVLVELERAAEATRGAYERLVR